MLTALLCSLTLSPAPLPLDETPAQATWKALLSRYSGAEAIELDCHMQLVGDDTPYHCQLKLARGLNGTALMARGEERIRFVGDGKSLYVLNDFQETYLRMPAGYKELPVVGYLTPLQAWAGTPAPEPTSLTLIESTPANPLVRVLQAEIGGKLETFWINPADQLLAASIDMPAPHGRVQGHVSFSKAEALRGVERSHFAGVLPPAYSLVAGPHDLLLPPGTPAPDVSFLTLDGKQVALDDYLGKTVVLSFWFYT